MITKSQYQRLLLELQKWGNMSKAAMKAGVDRKTARKYVTNQEPPEELQQKHTWRTRADPLEGVWPQAQGMLEAAPELEAKELFEFLLERHPDRIQPQHLRTFQRRVSHWRALYGPEKEVFFAQDLPPGKFMQLDWTNCNALEVMVQGVPLPHLLCHTVLPYSDWQWATRCQSESLLSLRHGLQEGLHQLGKVPEFLQVDQSSAATHALGPHQRREFNKDFVSVLGHYGMQARTIEVGKPNQNGDVESHNGHLKRRIEQHLLLRGSRNFDSPESYDQFLCQLLRKINSRRTARLNQELPLMRPLPPTRLSEYDDLTCPVSDESTIRVKKVTYSVPSRLRGHTIRVEVYESYLKIFHQRELVLEVQRGRGDRKAVIDWRHLIGPLLRKPGAFAHYRYRQEFFPTGWFREACDHLVEDHGQRRGELEYLHLLNLAAEVGVSPVERLLEYYRAPFRRPWWVIQLKQDMDRVPSDRPPLRELKPQLVSYDGLVNFTGEEASYVQ